MCGIFGYLNYNVSRSKKEILSILLNGIRRMEYRGYDSAGLAIDGDRIFENNMLETLVIKKCGKVNELVETVQQNERRINMLHNTITHFGIAHTRWATHGIPNEINCHPQSSDSNDEFLVVHNGIITNYNNLKAFLKKQGYICISETDTEVIAKMLKYFYDKSINELNTKLSFLDITKLVVEKLEGAYAVLIKSNLYPNECIAARKGSPLIVGIKTIGYPPTLRHMHTIINGTDIVPGSIPRLQSCLQNEPLVCESRPVEYFIASDACAIVEHTRDVIYLEECDIAYIDTKGVITFHNINIEYLSSSMLLSNIDAPINTIKREMQCLDIELNQIMKGKFDTFMEKEIFEQPDSLTNTLRGRINPETNEIILGGLSSHTSVISRCKRLIFIACGTSYNSAIAVRQLMIEMTDLPVMVEIASDFLDRRIPIFRDDVCVFISQSGETADTLGALRYCKSHQALLIGITNVVGSSISRDTDCGIHLNAGPEIGVASTKAYTSQIAALILMACWLGRDSLSKQKRIRDIINSLKKMPSIIERTLSCYENIQTISEKLKECKSMLIIGRGYHVATCLEGALKIKELSYIHSEGIMSGELKHGTLALIDEKMPVIFILSNDAVYNKSLNALEQILSRKCQPIIVCDEQCCINDPRIRIIIRVPHTIDCCQVIASVIPFQMLAMVLAKLRGHDVDFPRNLAKSVTVE